MQPQTATTCGPCAYQALVDSEARFRHIVESAQEGIWCLDAQGRTTFANPRLASLLGCGVEAMQGRSVREFLYDAADLDVAAAIQGLYERSIEQRDVRLRREDGSELWTICCARPNSDGGALIMLTDITERRQAEAAMRVVEERNRLAWQAAGMGTWDVDFVRDVHTWSVETEALFGLAPGTFGGTFEAFRAAVHPDDWPAFEVEDHAAQAERRDSISTYRTIWPDGSVHWIEEKGRPVYGADGKLVRMTGTSMDITERKRAEEALHTSEERFRKQYKGLPLPTYSWLQVGDDFVLQDYNDAAEAITNGQVRDWLGNRASEQYSDRPASLTSLQTCAAERRTIRRETQFRLPNTGHERHLALSYVFVPPQTVMVHTEDITEAKQAEKQRDALAQSEKLRALGQMATGIAHDINQSLMLVASYSDLARQALDHDPPNLEELRDLFMTATQAALDGGETVKRLLLFTRASVEQDRQHVDLTAIVRDAAQLTAPRWRDAAQAEGRPISMHIDAQGHPATVGSPGRIREVMTNLIFNAVDALPTGGQIALRVLVDDQHAIIEVTDSGMGMSAEVQARVFEPFFTTKGEGGTGLGLSMVFGIVEQHGGHIDIRSTPGQGTTFRISLPRVEPTAAVEPSRATVVALSPARPLRVLAVDDEPAMTKAVVRMLRPVGHVVSVAGSGEEALEQLTAAAATDSYDVVVSDMGMGPGMNGWDLAAEVKRRFPDVRFILATGWGAAIDPSEARDRGVEAVLAKPYRPVDLQQAVAGLDTAA